MGSKQQKNEFGESGVNPPEQNVEKAGLKRRDFFKIAAAAGVATSAAMMLPGCASGKGSSSDTSTKSSEKEKFEAYAAPIEPVEAPKSWDYELDAVVVGSGAGGMTACLRLAGAGLKVAVLEKSPKVGGMSGYSTIFMNLGGHKQANAAEWAYPHYPYDPDAIVEHFMDIQGLGGEPTLYRSMAVAAPQCIDWMIDDLKVPLVPMSNVAPVYTAYLIWEGSTTPKNTKMANSITMEYLGKLATEKGVTVLTDTEVSALVTEGDRVIGVKATSKGKDIFLKGSKGVVLAGGGFALNRAMVKKYCPTVFPGVANYYPPPTDTGECTRMGLGVGASIAGLNSAATYDGGIDWGATSEYDQWFTAHFVLDGATAVCRQPWLTIDALGNRVPYFSAQVQPYTNVAKAEELPGGLDETGAVHLTRFNGRAYVCFDSKFEEYTKDNKLFKVKLDRIMLDIEDDPQAERVPKENRNWHAGFNDAVANGAIKKCDTLDELEEALGLNKGILVNEVKKWNDACAAGVDYAANYKLNPEWLKPIASPPYYGAKIGGNIYGTRAGLRVNTGMQVINTKGAVIPGLYAGFHTAGGASGENNISSRTHGGVFGGVGTSFIGGYMAASSILGEPF